MKRLSTKEVLLEKIHKLLLGTLGPGYGIGLRNVEDLSDLPRSKLSLIVRILERVTK